MLATLPDTTVTRAGINSIAVGQVAIGPIRIGQLTVRNLNLRMSTGAIELRNFRVTVSLRLALVWKVCVGIPFDGSRCWDGTINLGEPSVTVPLGDVSIPGLQTFDINMGQLSLANVTATSSPLNNLRIGTAVAEQIRARNTTVPAQGFQIAGLGLNAVRMDGVGVPAVRVDEVAVGRVSGEALPLGGMTLANLALPATAVGDIVSTALDVRATAARHDIVADAGLLEITLQITPTARARMDRFSISGLNASGSIGSIELRDAVAPYELLNLTLSQIGIESIDIPTIGVS
jgi:hypothetical protein